MRRLALAVSLLLVGCRGQDVPDAPVDASAAAPTSTPSVEAPPGALIPIARDDYGRYQWAPRAPHIGDLAPDFTLPTVDGGTITLSAARAVGDVVVIFYRGFW